MPENFAVGLKAGDLDRRITFQTPAAGQDATGDPVPSWANVVTTWAHYEPLAVREPFTEGQFAAFADTKFVIRYRPDVAITPLMRIVDDHGRLYNIVGISEVRRRELVEIKAYARTEAG